MQQFLSAPVINNLESGAFMPALVHYGQSERHQREFSAAHLAQTWLAAASDTAFQTAQRPAVRRQVEPTAHDVVLSIDEKSRIQALDRTEPGLPM